MNTRISYLYRDASNFKQRNAVVFAGEITPAEEQELRGHLDRDDDGFVPGQVGLDDLQLRFGGLNSDDDAWHELENIELTESLPTETQTISEFVARFIGTTWDADSHFAGLVGEPD